MSKTCFHFFPSRRLKVAALAFTFTLLASGNAHSQSMPSVNGKAISAEVFNQAVSTNISQGQTDSPELRTVILEELINRELLAQDAQKKKLHQSQDGKARLEQARQAVLVDLAFVDYFAKDPITEAALKAEYQRQIELLGSLGPLQQYRLRVAMFETDKQARDALQRIRNGASFEEIVRKESIDASRANGGLLDWLLPNQILPAISNVIVNLSKGSTTAAPIQTPGGWNLVRVEDTRAFTPPRYEESLDQLRASLVQQRRAAYLTELRKAAKIERPQ